MYLKIISDVQETGILPKERPVVPTGISRVKKEWNSDFPETRNNAADEVKKKTRIGSKIISRIRSISVREIIITSASYISQAIGGIATFLFCFPGSFVYSCLAIDSLGWMSISPHFGEGSIITISGYLDILKGIIQFFSALDYDGTGPRGRRYWWGVGPALRVAEYIDEKYGDLEYWLEENCKKNIV